MKENTINNKLTEYGSFFWAPDYVDVSSAWTEHIPFAFWIIEVLNPKKFVELGVHTATSYFAFCQAVKTLNLDTTCYGVDTWKGDEHTGFYGDEVFEKVSNHNTMQFSRFSTLIRSTFDEAREYFIDKSIDLLHIDGFHTYEAVKHDFEFWLPKLSNSGLIILHDINVRERNFGVYKLWEELKEKYDHFQFDFGHGLGIVCMGKNVPDPLKNLINKNEGYYTFLRNYFSERGNFFKTSFGNYDLLEQQKEVNAQLNESKKTVELHNAQLSESHKTLESHIGKLNESHKTLELHNAQLSESHKVLESRIVQLELINRQLQVAAEAMKSHVADLSKKMRDVEVSLKKSLIALEEAKKENQLLNNHIAWYRDTYENRSLLGVLKEKIGGGKKKNLNDQKAGGILNKNIYQLIPANDIKRSGENAYTITGPDPFFFVDTHKKIKKGWYWLNIDIVETQGNLRGPRLYYDCGQGYNEEDIWNLPRVNQGKISGLVLFPSEIYQLRFDPTTIECNFVLKRFCLKSISLLEAFKRAGVNSRESHSPPFAVLTGFTSMLLKSGVAGINETIRNSVIITDDEQEMYKDWCALYDTISEKELTVIKSLADGLAYRPLFSIIMPVYNAPINYLKKAIESVKRQAYDHWELCIADDKSSDKNILALLKEYSLKDKRIKIVFRETNGHISRASNSALEIAKGDYVVLLDQDDELRPHSLYMVARAVNQNRKLELIYSDEDKIDEKGNRFDPYFKTDWNKDLFYGQNMINHLGVYKFSLVKKIGGFNSGCEGSQDYDLALRCIEHLKPDQIHHVPHVLYHWRAIKGSTAVRVSNKDFAIDAGLRALKDHLKRSGQNAFAEQNIHNSYRVKWCLPDQSPLVSIIIPTKNKADVLSTCVTSILEKTSYENFEILIIDNNSKDPLTLEYLKTVQKDHKQVKVYTYRPEFNFSAIVNYGVKQAAGEAIVLLNNDTEVINKDWLHEMVSQCMREEIGAVGAKLYYPNGQIQHAGVFLYEGHPGNHIYLRKDKNDPGYFNKLNLVQNYSVVTGACLAIRKKLYLEAGGFDERNLRIAYNDVDFCLKIRELGYKNLWTPFAQLIHHESLSRGSDLDEINFIRFKKEQGYMLAKWKDAITYDPFFNPNLGHDTRTNQLAFPPRVRYEWQLN